MGFGCNCKNIIKSICNSGTSTEFTKEDIGIMASRGVTLRIHERHVVMDNGLVQVTLSKPDGIITGISYQGIDNLLEVRNKESNRGYWDVVWNAQDGGKAGVFEVIHATNFKVVKETDEQVELSFSRPWDTSLQGKLVPLNIDKRFILLRGCSGFYTYAIYEHVGSMEWPAFSLGETRIAFKLRKDKFHYMAVSDNRQRFMPLPDDRLPGRCQPLAYAEAVKLIDPIEPELRGEVDDKYQYSCENKDLKVHGWISMDPPVGFWQINPSDEFRSGGPLKQNLTSHVGPTTLAVFLSGHYAGDDLVPKFGHGEPWKKVFGPIFIYLNSLKKGEDPLSLWADAKRQMAAEVQSWPYDFPASEDFPASHQRGNVKGKLLVLDRYVHHHNSPAKGAYVGLAVPGDVGSWQRECKHYQFWTRADDSGLFCIKNVHCGNYNLYAWIPGYVGDFKMEDVISIHPGCTVDMGDVVFEPPRHGPTLWEIGFPDRSAAKFHVPEPNPDYNNKVLVNDHDRYRQYGLWERYAELYPNEDLVYNTEDSDYRKDWFFAQVPRKKEDNTFQGTTWQIKFKLQHVDRHGTYTLRVAVASATLAELQVRVNNPNARRPLFTSGLIGRDNSIARHGIHGLYWLYAVDIQGSVLVDGENVIYLTQPRCVSPFQGIMYDYIRLEGPPCSGPEEIQ
ncbi:lyase [Lithospermum erythrorhizon]|uniref:rhamnogalacturonan endolyase n=1 Tax=Lithospermum erythrorhizon TaxID=34254 RepID=A0AAV3QEB3_LITER